MRMLLTTAIALLPTAAGCAPEWHSAPLYPALARQNAVLHDKPGKPCPPVPPALRDVETVSKYGEKNDTNSTVIDPASEAQYDADMKPIQDFGREIVRRADHYVEGDASGVSDARCALAWLDGWAQGEAFLGKINRQGQSVRKWELATFATTYIKISGAPLDPAAKARVRAWIRRVALGAKEDFSSQTQLKSRQNNHVYWAAWGVTAAGIAVSDKALFDWGIERYRQAIDGIADDGSLPLELDRRTKAASYHMFALQPLIMLAEAGEANGIAMYAYRDKRLQRLIDLNLAALDDMEVIGRLNGFKQENLYSESVLSWMEPYYARFHDPRLVPWLKKYRPMASRRTGGNLTALYTEAQ